MEQPIEAVDDGTVTESKLTARERGVLEGRREAFRQCAGDLRIALKELGDPQFRAACVTAALDWYDRATDKSP